MFPPVIDLDNYRRQREAGAKARPIPITSEPDPENPNCDWHLIVDEDRNVVQAGIEAVFAHVESFGNGGEGHVHVFRRMGGLYFAIIQTVRFAD